MSLTIILAADAQQTPSGSTNAKQTRSAKAGTQPNTSDSRYTNRLIYSKSDGGEDLFRKRRARYHGA